MSKVLLDIQDHIAHVRLNRPDKRNGLDMELIQQLIATGEELAGNGSVRAVVLSGEGPSFCAGLDVASMMGNAQAMELMFSHQPGQTGNLAQRPCLVWLELPVPVIAAIQGHCFGGGLQIALGADIRYCTPHAQLSVMEMKWGLIPDMGITQTLTRLVRIDVAKELTYTGRVLSGTEAAQLGLVSHVSDTPLDDAMTLAHTLVGKSPDAISRAKQLFNEAWLLPAEEALLREEMLQKKTLGAHNQIEAVMANMQKRPPAFRDRSTT